MNMNKSNRAIQFSGILFIFVICLQAGCWFNKSKNPVAVQSQEDVAITQLLATAREIKFKILFPTKQTIFSANILPGVVAPATSTPEVTFKLTLVNTANPTNPVTIFVKTVPATASGTAEVTFSNIPAFSCIGEITIQGGSIEGISHFHGAKDLIANETNVIEIAPFDSKLLPDIVAKVLLKLSESPEAMSQISSFAVEKIKTAIAGININSSSIYDDAYSKLITFLSAPPSSVSTSLERGKIVSDPQTGSLILQDEILVTFKDPPTAQELASVTLQMSGTLLESYPELKTYRYRIPILDVNSLINKVNSLQTKAFENNYNFNFGTHVVFKVKAIPDDPDYTQNWGLEKIGAPQTWQNLPQTSISVAVIDTGCRKNHEDLASNLDIANGINLTSDNNGDSKDFEDGNGHGTHCSGIIASVMNNGKGTVGVAPNVKIVPIKVLENDGVGSVISVSLGIKMAADIANVRVISLSLGGAGNIPRMMKEAVDYASERGKLVVVAAGNENDDAAYFSPASYEKCFCVGATTNNDTRAWFSNYGSAVDIAAPGNEIYSTYGLSDSSYETLSGTSMATPFVSGLAAAVFSLNPSITSQEVRDIIQQNADPLITDKPIGAGRINAFKTISAIGGAPGNQIPRVTLEGPENVSSGENIEYIANAEDSDDSTVSFSWETNSASPIVENFTDGTRSIASWKAPGVSGWYEISCQVTDPKGGKKETSIQTFVKPSSISINYVSPASSTVGGLIKLYGANFGAEQNDGQVFIGVTTFTEIISWTNTQISVTVPATAESGDLKVFSSGLESNSIPFQVHYKPTKPTISSPYINQNNVILNPVLSTTAFSDPNKDDYHLTSDWEVYDSIGGNIGTKVWEKFEDRSNLTSIEVNAQNGSFTGNLLGQTTLAYETGYFLRIRFSDNFGFFSEWSDLVNFTTMSEPQLPPQKPSITISAGSILGVMPTITANSFADPNSKSIHQFTDWELYDFSTLSSGSRVWFKHSDTTNKTNITVDSSHGLFENSLAGKTKLSNNTRYWVRVRYTDDTSLQSIWSDLIELIAMNAQPAISCASPTQSISIQENTAVALEVIAADSDGQVIRVEFADNGIITHTIVSSPFIASYSSLSPGIHKISAKAIDDQLGETVVDFPDVKVLLQPPTDLVAAGATGGNNLSWSSHPLATSYNVYWSETPNVTQANGNKIFSTESSFFHSSLIAGKAYYYVVTAVSDAGESKDSVECSASPLLGPPSSVFISPGVDQNAISWSAVSGATSYDIIWASNTASLTASGTRIENVSSPFVHKSIVGLIPYTYAVLSKNEFTVSPLSSPVSGTPKKGLSNIKAVSCSNHTLAIDNSNAVYAWGNNRYGQIGDGTEVNKSSAIQVIDNINYVSSGYSLSLAAKIDGIACFWGMKPGTSVSPIAYHTPTNTTASNIMRVAGGMYHALALSSDGFVYSWGENGKGQLGMGNLVDLDKPAQIPSLNSIIDIDAGVSYSLAVKVDGSVLVWGDNRQGQLGMDANFWATSPQINPNLSGIIAVSAGYSHSLALSNDGSVWSWGDNTYGQLGLGHNDLSSYPDYPPENIPTFSNVIAISAGNYHCLALTQDGSVWSWGRNNYGQLGDGTTVEKTTPTRVPNLSGVIGIAAGWAHSVVIKSDGTVWSWGQNTSGELGDGSIIDRLQPVQVIVTK